jgi:hypothetical protein
MLALLVLLLAPPWGVRHDPIFAGDPTPGTVALTPGELAAVGWLHFAGQPGPDGHQCTVTLITARVALTAGHCFAAGVEGFEVSVGPDGAAPLATAAVVDTALHPHDDVALVLLDGPIDAGLPAFSAIPLALTPPEGLLGHTLTAVGYGHQGDGVAAGRRFADLNVGCVEPAFLLLDSPRQALCRGDSGGPLLMLDPLLQRPAVVAIEVGGNRDCPDLAGGPEAIDAWLAIQKDWMVRVDRVRLWIEAETARLEGRGLGALCGGLSERGRCDGEVLRWCAGVLPLERDCRLEGATCGATPSGPACVPPALCGADEGVTCEGAILRRCRGGRVESVDCAAAGQTCAPGVSDCVPVCYARSVAEAVPVATGGARFRGGCAAAGGAAAVGWGWALLALSLRRRRPRARRQGPRRPPRG